MTNLPGIVVTGASGRMGQMLVRSIAAHDKMKLVGCVERSGHAWVGQDIGLCMGGAAIGVLLAAAIVVPLAVLAGLTTTLTPGDYRERFRLRQIEEAVNFALEAPFPSFEEASRDVYGDAA